MLLNFAKSLLIPGRSCRPFSATAFTCFVPRSDGRVNGDDYNTPTPPVYRVIGPSQNRNGCFRLANQHSLLPAPSPHACSAAHASAPRNGACACTTSCPLPKQSMLPGTAKTVVAVSAIHENGIMRGGRHGVIVRADAPQYFPALMVYRLAQP